MQCSQDLQKLLQILNRNPRSFEDILDFGCGCGRVSRYFFDHHTSTRLYGTDIDSEVITWCKAHFPNPAQWSVNNHLPPTAYDSNTFDLIYVVSVFTHLHEEHQFAWLAELKRISRSGCVIILTVHGSVYYDTIAMPEKGFLHKLHRSGAFQICGLPEYYQTTYHKKHYIEQEWSQFFTIGHYVERGIANHQDAIILFNE